MLRSAIFATVIPSIPMLALQTRDYFDPNFIKASLDVVISLCNCSKSEKVLKFLTRKCMRYMTDHVIRGFKGPGVQNFDLFYLENEKAM